MSYRRGTLHLFNNITLPYPQEQMLLFTEKGYPSLKCLIEELLFLQSEYHILFPQQRTLYAFIPKGYISTICVKEELFLIYSTTCITVLSSALKIIHSKGLPFIDMSD